MANDMQEEGLIPHGLHVETLKGSYEGSLTVSGTANHVDIKVKELRIEESGHIEHGDIEADYVFMNGHVSGVTFQVMRFNAGAQAHLADSSLEMGNPAGCMIHEEACFEGDVRISVTRHLQKPVVHPEIEPDIEDDKSALTSSSEVDHDEPPSEWSGLMPDISEAEEDADIPLG